MFERSRTGAVDIINGDDPLNHQNAPELAALLDECLVNGQPRAERGSVKPALPPAEPLQTRALFLQCLRGLWRIGGAQAAFSSSRTASGYSSKRRIHLLVRL